MIKAAPPLPNIPWVWFTSDCNCTSTQRNCYLFDPSSSTSTQAGRCPALFKGATGTRTPYITLSISSARSDDEWTYNKPQYLYTRYNPYTGDAIELPCMFYDEYGRRCPLDEGIIYTIFSSPSSVGLVVAWVAGWFSLLVCKLGFSDWVMGSIPHVGPLRDTLCYRGQFYSISQLDVMVFDIKHANRRRCGSSPPSDGRVVAPCDMIWDEIIGAWDPPAKHDLYLVESNEELLVVAKSSVYGKKIITFAVFRLDLDGEKGELIRVHDLGDRMLFVQRAGSLSTSAATDNSETSENNFFTKNCIYFFELEDDKKVLSSIGKFEVGTGSPSKFYSGHVFTSQPIWVPSPLLN